MYSAKYDREFTAMLETQRQRVASGRSKFKSVYDTLLKIQKSQVIEGDNTRLMKLTIYNFKTILDVEKEGFIDKFQESALRSSYLNLKAIVYNLNKEVAKDIDDPYASQIEQVIIALEDIIKKLEPYKNSR